MHSITCKTCILKRVSSKGPKTDLPTLIFESDGSHGLGDWLGLLNAVKNRTRACFWDKPGVGWADYMTYNQFADAGENYKPFYPQLMEALEK